MEYAEQMPVKGKSKQHLIKMFLVIERVVIMGRDRHVGCSSSTLKGIGLKIILADNGREHYRLSGSLMRIMSGRNDMAVS